MTDIATAHGGLATRRGSTVELLGLRRTFGDVVALDGLDLALQPGELVALLGPSGCGKTTALRILAGLDRADAGRVRVDGRDVTDVPANRRHMGMVFQAYSLFPNLSARDNVSFGLRVRRRPARQRRDRAGELLDLVGLSRHADRYPHELSGGQQQRVALARALAVEPQVLLLDEPLSALDAQVRGQLRDEIRRLQLEVGITTLFVTHDQEEALSIADRVGVMSHGRLEQIASPDVVYTQPQTAFVAEFVGAMNRVPAELTATGARLLGRDVAVTDRPSRPAGEQVAVLVRPEALAVEAAGDGSAVVVSRSFLGPVTRVFARLPEGVDVMVDLPSAAAAVLPPGTQVRVTLLTDRVLAAAT
ncbi:MAG: ABC transporter ATP-binding protein [Actinomycetota bacterium]